MALSYSPPCGERPYSRMARRLVRSGMLIAALPYEPIIVAGIGRWSAKRRAKREHWKDDVELGRAARCLIGKNGMAAR